MKITLGTAQFGMQYGISNTTGQVTDKKLIDIVRCLRSRGHNNFDTARAYGNSEKRISKLLLPNDCVTTKIPPNLSKNNYEEWFDQNLTHSLKALNRSYIENLIFHRSEDLLLTPKNFLEQKVKALKENQVIEKFGVSVYDKNEISHVLDHINIDFIQFPLNLFDRSFLHDDLLYNLKNKGLTLEVRSIFLQGLLLMSSSELPSQFSPWAKEFKKLDLWLSEETSISRLEACIGFIKSIREIDRVVVGVQGPDELNEIIDAFNKPMNMSYPNIESTDKKLVNPSLWPPQS